MNMKMSANTDPFILNYNFFPTSSLKMTFPSLNLEMKVGVCITCEESKSLPSLVGKVKQKFDPHLGMYIISLK
jgi:hypothetical protein